MTTAIAVPSLWMQEKRLRCRQGTRQILPGGKNGAADRTPDGSLASPACGLISGRLASSRSHRGEAKCRCGRTTLVMTAGAALGLVCAALGGVAVKLLGWG
jgi:hypothetical protein